MYHGGACRTDGEVGKHVYENPENRKLPGKSSHAFRRYGPKNSL
jgi:hypothetical protein